MGNRKGSSGCICWSGCFVEVDGCRIVLTVFGRKIDSLLFCEGLVDSLTGSKKGRREDRMQTEHIRSSHIGLQMPGQTFLDVCIGFTVHFPTRALPS